MDVTAGSSEDASAAEDESSHELLDVNGAASRRRRRRAADDVATLSPDDHGPYSDDDIEFILNPEDGTFSIVVPDKDGGAG